MRGAPARDGHCLCTPSTGSTGPTFVALPVPSWTLTDFTDLTGVYGIAGYGVLDALGVRIGHVSGWVTDGAGEIGLLKVTVRDWFKSSNYLLPLGTLSLIDDGRQHLHLRQLTKRALMKHCLPLEDGLPPTPVLDDLVHFFPNPRPSIVERLADPARVPAAPMPGRLTLHPDQGDGLPDEEVPVAASTPPWTKLGRLAPPPWTPLSNFLRELGNRR